MYQLFILGVLVLCASRYPEAFKPPESPPTPLVRRSTDGGVASRDFNAQVNGVALAFERTPQVSALGRQLVDLLLTRVGFFGTFSDVDRALTLADAALAKAPADAEAVVLKAQVLSAVHRFDEALALVLPLAAKTPSAQRVVDTVYLATAQHLNEVLARRRAGAAAHRSYASLTALAAAESAVGHYATADRLYVEAAGAYRDVSPFALAWIAFQRGMMWSESAGRPEWAAPLYREAVARLPGYVVANVHLAELLAEQHHADEALASLERVMESTEDPEALGRAAELLAERDPARSSELRARAVSGYEALLARHRSAFLDHAAELYLGVGADPQRALALAEENLRLRPTERAYRLAIEAAQAADKAARACELSRAAPHEPVTQGLAQALVGACD